MAEFGIGKLDENDGNGEGRAAADLQSSSNGEGSDSVNANIDKSDDVEKARESRVLDLVMTAMTKSQDEKLWNCKNDNAKTKTCSNGEGSDSISANVDNLDDVEKVTESRVLDLAITATTKSQDEKLWNCTNDDAKTNSAIGKPNDQHDVDNKFEDDDVEDENEDDTEDSVTKECEVGKRDDNTPEKHKKNNKKTPSPANIAPRRSTRNINKQKLHYDKDNGNNVYKEGSGECVQLKNLVASVADNDDIEELVAPVADDDDIEEVIPTDPLADDGKSKLRNKTIVVSDTKGLVEFATNARVSKSNKKEPTLVIIDTKSILSGQGPVPVSQSSNNTSLLHSAGNSKHIPVSLPISASALSNTSRSISATSSSAFSVIPIGLPAQGLHPQYKTPPPQMKPIIVGPASTSVTPISLHTSLTPSSNNNVGLSSMSASVNVTTSTKQQAPIILPSLTDDMFVVEAPSFIVPYVYEKPPMKALEEHLEKMGTEIRDAEALEKERESQDNQLDTSVPRKSDGDKENNEEKSNTEQSQRLDSPVEKGENFEEPIKNDTSLMNEPNDRGEKMAVDHDVPENIDNVDQTKAEKSGISSGEVNPKELDETLSKVTSASIVSNDCKTLDQTILPEKSDNVEEKKDISDTQSTVKDDKKTSSAADDSKKPSSSFFNNPLGKFFIQIGLNLVQEHVQTDLLRSQKRKRDKEGENCSAEVHATISELTRTLESSKENNDPFKMETKKCELCSFRTESLLVMAHHLETPHMKNYTYRCNFCPLEVRSPHDILFHMEAEHNVRGRLERAPAFHQCPNCPFEDNQKGKLTRHMVSCSKKYRPEKNQEPPLDWEPPAKIPRVTRNRPPSMSPGNAVYQAAMSGLKQVSQNTLLPKLMPNSSNLKHNMMNTNKRSSSIGANFVGQFPNTSTQSNFQQRPISIQNTNQGLLYRTSLTNSQTQVLLPQNYQLPASNAALYQSSNVKQSQQGLTAAKLLNQPSISITPLPRQNPIPQPSSSSNNAVINSTSSAKSGKPAAVVAAAAAAASNNKSSFVVCEICDGYIKDLEQLRNHMQLIHKVKIHPKMIYNRPPLNCQKCQFRFFTDQGLERHLLGSHGLVTSSMQEAANKGKDGGRCPVCGRVYQWKLLNHVARDHQMALKPAHLSYKCTVCTATFGMYKQFESHVYSAHSMVAKRAMDPKKPPLASSSASLQSDALLKPLKINDEITIIPQPVRSSKPMNKNSGIGSSVINNRNKLSSYCSH